MTIILPDAAMELLQKYNQEDFHIKHGRTVGGVMRILACEMGYEADADYWESVGILHDIDFEQWPEQHCQVAPRLLSEAGLGEDIIHAVVSHGYGLCSGVKPEHEMEKVLFACDELTGLIGACAPVRPSKSIQDMELKSLKKKFKSASFAAGCDREVIKKGAEMLGWDLDELMQRTLNAMKQLPDYQ